MYRAPYGHAALFIVQLSLEARGGGGGGGYLVSTMLGCVCQEVKDRGQVNEMNERTSFKMDVKFEVSLHMGIILFIDCID